MPKPNILVVEDDADLREAIADTLEIAGLDFMTAEDAERALIQLRKTPVSLVISDISMPGMDGHQLLETILKDFPGTPVVLMTAHGSVADAVGAIRNGAADYLVKPFDPDTLVELAQHYAGDASSLNPVEPVAEDAGSRELLGLARRVAASDSTVLISGESGTGKEVLARYIHQHSACSEGPFVAINCAAIPENMLEATLFGYEKGAFTGAVSSSPGKFEQAENGTILLDEISEMELGLQAKLLRVLQEREVERIGGRRTIQLNVRVISTTNRDLHQHVADGGFREDLFYRLSVFPLQWQPLRERTADIIPLAMRLLRMHAQKMQRPAPGIAAGAQDVLRTYAWPGNVRELDNAIQRALILSAGSELGVQDFRLDGQMPLAGDSVPESTEDPATDQASELNQDLRSHEFSLIVDAVRNAGGSRKRAAETLGLSPRTLRYKLARFREMGMDLDESLQPS